MGSKLSTDGLAHLVRRVAPGTRDDMPSGGCLRVETVREADGVIFRCPICANGHAVLCWLQGRGVPDDESPGPGRWHATGNTIDDLTLSPSVHLNSPGCGWHGYVRNGIAE